MEEWKVIEQAPDYMISNEGRVKSLKRGRELILSDRVGSDGYLNVSLSTNGKAKYYRVSRLVAEYFVPNPENKPSVNHIDGDKQNNHHTNLEWTTMHEQVVHAYKLGLKKPMRNRYLLADEEIREINRTYKPHSKEFGMIALAKKYNVSCETIKRWAKEPDVESCLKRCNDYRNAKAEKNC